MANAQSDVQYQAAVQAQKLAMDSAKQAADTMQKMLDTTQVVSDPNLGQRINVTA